MSYNYAPVSPLDSYQYAQYPLKDKPTTYAQATPTYTAYDDHRGSSNNSGPAIPGWPNQPKTTRKSLVSATFDALYDIALFVVPTAFILVAVLGKSLDQKTVEGNGWGEVLISVTKFVRVSNSLNPSLRKVSIAVVEIP